MLASVWSPRESGGRPPGTCGSLWGLKTDSGAKRGLRPTAGRQLSPQSYNHEEVALNESGSQYPRVEPLDENALTDASTSAWDPEQGTQLSRAQICDPQSPGDNAGAELVIIYYVEHPPGGGEPASHGRVQCALQPAGVATRPGQIHTGGSGPS